MTDKILSVVSAALLIAFMGVVATFVHEPDLWLVVILVLGFALYDFWSTHWSNGGETGTERDLPDQHIS